MDECDKNNLDDLEDQGPLSVDLEELGDDAETDTLPCGACGEEIYADSVRCNSCGRYVTLGRSAARPWWWLLAALASAGLIVYLTLRA